MSFYLNRTGSAEGPLSEQQIVAMIQRGEVTQANICAVGQNQWQPVASHPAFAAALAQRGGGGAHGAAPAPQQNYGAPPQQAPGYGAQPQQQPPAYGSPPQAAPGPTAPGYGPAPAPGPTAPGYGPPVQGAYGAAPAPGFGGAQPYVPAQVAQATPKKGKGGLIAIIGVLVVLVLGGGAAAAYFMFLGGRGPEIAAALPRDTELYFEIPNVKRLALDLHGLDFVDQKAADEKKLLDDTTQAMSEAFDLSKDDAKDLLFSMASLGMGARKLDKSGEGAFLVGFDDTDAVEKLLATKRFTTAGTFGEAGKKYQLEAKKVEGTPPKDPTKAALFAMEVKGSRDVLVWFPKQKLLVSGTEAIVADVGKVLEQGAASLKKNETFETGSKDFASDARAVAFYDPSIALANVDADAKEIVDGYFRNRGPITGSVTIRGPGPVFDMTARFTGSQYPKGGVSKAVKLDAAKRLPAETFAYTAFTPKALNMTGADIEKRMLDQLKSIDKDDAVRTEQQLREMERALGVTLTKLVDSIGEQSVMAFAAPETFTIDPTRGEKQMMDMAAFAIVKLNDEVPMKTVLSKLKEQFGQTVAREATLTEESGGYVITSKVPDLPISMHAKIVDKQLVVALGNNALVAKGLTAITSGAGSLESSGAHKAALDSLPAESHLVTWIDAGRIGDTLQRSPLLKKQIDELGFDLGKFKFTGDQRVTSAFSLDVQTEGDVWTYKAHTVNAPALATLSGAMALVSAATVTAALAAPPDLNTGFNPQALGTGIGTITPPPLPTDTAALVPTTPTTGGVFKVGDKVDVEWHGKFYPSTVLAVLPDDKYKIHFDGWSNSWDEVVPVKRIKAK